MKAVALRLSLYAFLVGLVMVGLFWAFAPQFRLRLLSSSRTVAVDLGLEGKELSGIAASRSLKIVTVLPKDAIRAILSPNFLSASQGGLQMFDEEPVLGVFVNGEAKAYSIAQLSSHEIVNDVVGGIPVAVTW